MSVYINVNHMRKSTWSHPRATRQRMTKTWQIMAQSLPVSCAQKSSRNAPLCVMTDVVSASVPQHGDDLRGPWFSAEQQASMQSLGQWSDSFCSCLADKKMGLLSFLCSWYVVFITMQKIGTVSTVCGPLTKERFGFALVIFVLLWALLRSVTSSLLGILASVR